MPALRPSSNALMLAREPFIFQFPAIKIVRIFFPESNSVYGLKQRASLPLAAE
jgi:hypothetical protein